MRTMPDVGVRMQPRIDSSVVLPLPDGPISSVSSPCTSDRSTPLSATTIPAPLPSSFTTFSHFENGARHLLNTMAGSILVTLMIADMAEIADMKSVSPNSDAASPGVMTSGSGVLRLI